MDALKHLRMYLSTRRIIHFPTRSLIRAVAQVNKLLQPHFRWTMRPNADARQNLIAADGIIETAFTIGSFSMELISKIYGSEWRFDRQSLPDDLIARSAASPQSAFDLCADNAWCFKCAGRHVS